MIPQPSIIRLTKFAKLLKRGRQALTKELNLYQDSHPKPIKVIFRNTQVPKSPWYVDLIELYRAGYIQDQLLISAEAKLLKEELDALDERITTLEGERINE